LTSYISQGQDNAAADLRGGGSFIISFLYGPFLNLTVKNYENWSTFAAVTTLK